MNKLALNFVVHKGKLETQALLLVTSLQLFNKNQFELNACVPVEQGGLKSGVSTYTKKILLELGVNFYETENPIGGDYLIGNKLPCLDVSDNPFRCFLDTDIICCSKLSFPSLEKETIAVKPADRNTASWSNGDWKKAYKEFAQHDFDNQDITISTAFKEIMPPYYNAGVILLNSKNQFSNIWSNISINLDKNTSYTNKRPWLDQLALPLAIKKAKLNTFHLTESHNFPANIKPVDFETQLVHYHRPEAVSRNSRLIDVVDSIITTFPWVRSVLEADCEWADVLKLTSNKTKNYRNPPSNKKNVIITGIPRSGTSYLCSLINKIPNHVVINEPLGVTRPLKKRYIPWGLAGYYGKSRRDIALGRPVLNKLKDGELVEDTIKSNERTPYTVQTQDNNFFLYTKNTIAYLSSLLRIKMVLPDAKIIGLYRSPKETIASWNTSFPHLKEARPSSLKVLANNMQWLSKSEKEMLMVIEDCHSEILRQALLWNFFANQLIKFQSQIVLIDYNSLILNPNKLLSLISGSEQNGFQASKIQSKAAIFSSEETAVIDNITRQSFLELEKSRVC